MGFSRDSVELFRAIFVPSDFSALTLKNAYQLMKAVFEHYHILYRNEYLHKTKNRVSGRQNVIVMSRPGHSRKCDYHSRPTIFEMRASYESAPFSLVRVSRSSKLKESVKRDQEKSGSNTAASWTIIADRQYPHLSVQCIASYRMVKLDLCTRKNNYPCHPITS